MRGGAEQDRAESGDPGPRRESSDIVTGVDMLLRCSLEEGKT